MFTRFKTLLSNLRRLLTLDLATAARLEATETAQDIHRRIERHQITNLAERQEADRKSFQQQIDQLTADIQSRDAQMGRLTDAVAKLMTAQHAKQPTPTAGAGTEAKPHVQRQPRKSARRNPRRV